MKKPFTYLGIVLCLILFECKAQTNNCSPPSKFDSLNINNVNARLTNGGDMWWDLVSSYRYEVPYNHNETQRGPSSLFAGGLWIGGFDAGHQLHVAAATYRQNGNDYFPGPLDANGIVTPGTCGDFDRMWKVNKTTIDSFRVQTFPVSPSSIPANIFSWPAKGNPYNPSVGNRDMAPFIDVDGDSIYNPAKGDYPDVLGDQAVWWVFNDMGNTHTETQGLPLGLEVQVQAFAYKTNDALNNATFYKYKLIYKGSSPLDSVFIGFFADADLGCYTDDYFGCDSTRNMGICYNATANDGGIPSSCALNYGNQPPIVGVKLLEGIGFPPNEPYRMSRFMVYGSTFDKDTGFPTNKNHYYDYLSGTWKDSTYWTEGGTAHGGLVKTNYMFPGEPNNPQPSWSMCSIDTLSGPIASIADEMLLSSGPHHLNEGDIRTFFIGIPWVQPPVGTYPCPSFASLDSAADLMQSFFQSQIIAAGVQDVKTMLKNIVTIFPNPSTGNVTMQFTDNHSKQITLYNLLGVEVKAYNNVQQKTLTINRNGLPNGVYFYKVSNAKNEIQTGKLML